MKKDTCLIVVLLVCTMVLLPCSDPIAIAAAGRPDDSGGIRAEPLGSSSDQIDITEAGFDPETLTVTVDSPVTWTNTTIQAHRLVSGEPYRVYLPLVLRDAGSGGGPSTPGPKAARAETRGVVAPGWPSSLFEETLAPGQRFSHTFALSGTYPYYLATAPQFTGQVIVTPLTPTLALTLTAHPTTLAVGSSSTLTATVADEHGDPAPDGTEVLFETGLGAAVSPRATSNGVATSTLTSDVAGTAQVTATTGTAKDTAVVTFTSGVPADPSTVAPPLDQTVATTMISATAFLYTGDDAIQTGVTPGTIEAKRVAVLRGRVAKRDGELIPGVTITVLGHPEFGQTLTRENGAFDMAVNGGSQLVVQYEKDGYLTVQRDVQVPWQDYVWLPEVVMIARDAKVTAVDLSADEMQAAQGSVSSDTDGTRKATVLVPQDTQAEIMLSDGTTQTVSALNIRATEFTEGDSGPQAMPAELPAVTGYTYAVEVTADEAVEKVDGRDVLFSQPVYFYLENFLDFPTGASVPMGYYDDDNGRWVPSDNGRVVDIVSMSDGLADLDTDGDGVADNGEVITPTMALTITTAERTQLAELYTIGQSLWRVPIPHFSIWDANWGVGPPSDAAAAEIRQSWQDYLSNPLCWVGLCERFGSVVGAQNQTLGEAVEMAGTPFSLHYRSERTPGFRAAYSLDIPVSTEKVPTSTKRIELEISVAGRSFTATLPTTPNQVYHFEWDGRDAYGRPTQGAYPATIRIGYVYDGTYQEPADIVRSFGYRGNGVPFTYNRARQAFILWQEMKAPLGTWDARGFGLGGWSLSVHHAYDPVGRILHRGDGGRRSAETEGHVIDSIAGGGADQECATCAAEEVQMDRPHGLALAPDGSLVIADTFKSRVRVLRPDGTVETLTSLNEHLAKPMDVALAPDGTLYVADTGSQYAPGHNRILRVEPDGSFGVVVGTGSAGYNGDGIPAAEAQLSTPHGVAVGPDGSLYVADTGSHRIRQIGPDGTIQTVAGTGTAGFSGDGGPATQAQIDSPWGLTVTKDGSLYFADHNNRRIRRVSVEGIITTVGPEFDLATSDVALGEDGSLYVTLGGSSIFDVHQAHRIAPDGTVTAVAGDGTAGFSGDGGPATKAQLSSWTYGVIPGPDNNLYLTDNDRVREVSLPLPGFDYGELAIPSADGSLLYQFDAFGRHRRTLDSLTAAPVYTFTYNTEGRLTTIKDGDGDVMAIERTSGITPTAIVAPFGQRTELSANGDGYLASITDPLSRTHTFGYTAGGLLETMTDPRDAIHCYQYDAAGRLTREETPTGAFTQLARLEDRAAYTTTVRTAEGLTTTYHVGFLDSGEQTRGNTFPNGTQNEVLLGADASTTITYTDGTRTHESRGGDPRFEMQAPMLAQRTIDTPGGHHYQLDTQRAAALSSRADPLSLETMTDTVTVNGRTYTRTYDAMMRTWTGTSPESRMSASELDRLGRPVTIGVTDIEPFAFTYDDHGRLEQVAQGTRLTTRAYDSASGYLKSSTDALSHTTSYSRDAAGRLISLTWPDGSTWGYGWDGNDNLTALTEPDDGAQHVLTYTLDDQLGLYRSPLAAEERFAYDMDGRLVRREFPSMDALEWLYDDEGQLVTVRTPEGDHTFGYSDATGLLTRTLSRDGQQVTYAYDGNLLTEASWHGLVTDTVSYAYDDDLRVSQMDYAGTRLPMSYDGDGLLIGVGSIGLSPDADNGLLRGIADGAFDIAYGYNAYGELNALTATHDAALYQATYTRDALGRIAKKVETIGGSTHTWTYSYDAVGQLTTVRRDGAVVEAYDYDAVGNRLAMDNELTDVTVPNGGYSYDADHKLLTAGSASYTYDADGRLRTVSDGGTTTYTYNTDGTLASVQIVGQTIAYQYDAQGRRVARGVDGVCTHAWLYGDGLMPLAEYDGSGHLRTVFVYAGGPTPVSIVRGGTTYDIVSDHLGSVRLVVDDAGAVVKQVDYDSFGNVIADTNPGFDLPFGFAGGLADPDHELVRFGARDYQPSTGCWTAKDPILFGGGYHLYGYVGNDPMNWSDRDGLQSGCLSLPAYRIADFDLVEAMRTYFEARERLATARERAAEARESVERIEWRSLQYYRSKHIYREGDIITIVDLRCAGKKGCVMNEGTTVYANTEALGRKG